MVGRRGGGDVGHGQDHSKPGGYRYRSFHKERGHGVAGG